MSIGCMRIKEITLQSKSNTEELQPFRGDRRDPVPLSKKSTTLDKV